MTNLSPNDEHSIDFERHPLVLNARDVKRNRRFALCITFVCVLVFIAGLLSTRRVQRCVIFFGSGQMAVGELADLNINSELMTAICTHYAEQMLTWDSRYKEGILRPSHLNEIATSGGKSEIDSLRERIRNTLQKNNSNQSVLVQSVNIRRDGRELVATVSGTLTIFKTFGSRNFVDEFVLNLKLKSTYDDDLRDGDSSQSFFSFFKRPAQNGITFFYPFVISSFTLEKENIK